MVQSKGLTLMNCTGQGGSLFLVILMTLDDVRNLTHCSLIAKLLVGDMKKYPRDQVSYQVLENYGSWFANQSLKVPFFCKNG